MKPGSGPERDTELGEVLMRLESHGAGEGDDILRHRIVAAARDQLAARRAHGPTWWNWNARWARITVPVGLAAGFVAAVLVVRTPSGPSDRVADSLQGAVAVAGTERIAVDPLLDAPDGDWLLSEAMQR